MNELIAEIERRIARSSAKPPELILPSVAGFLIGEFTALTDLLTWIKNQQVTCPFCGKAEHVVIYTEDQYAFVKCQSCGASGPEIAGQGSKQAAIKAWNERTA